MDPFITELEPGTVVTAPVSAPRAFITVPIWSPQFISTDPAVIYCDTAKYQRLMSLKNEFDLWPSSVFYNARDQAYPLERVGKGPFAVSRASLKLANIDAIFKYALSEHTDLSNIFTEANPAEGTGFVFAVTAEGPGGFVEYLTFRRPQCAGSGITITSETDSLNWSPLLKSDQYNFEQYYGPDNTGDLYTNSEHYIKHVLNKYGRVNLCTGDGGFELSGYENKQEWLSSRLLLCQIAVALGIVKAGGNFVCKVFDTTTETSAQLIGLCTLCFEEVTIVKPASSRFANAERYLVCRRLTNVEFATMISKALLDINKAHPASTLDTAVSSSSSSTSSSSSSSKTASSSSSSDLRNNKFVVLERVVAGTVTPQFRDWLVASNNLSLETQLEQAITIVGLMQGKAVPIRHWNDQLITQLWNLPNVSRPRTDIPSLYQFPYSRAFLDPPEIMFQRLRDFTPVMSTEAWTVYPTMVKNQQLLTLDPARPGVPLMRHQGQLTPVRFLDDANLYHTINSLPDHFTEEARVRTRYRKQQSVYEWWCNGSNRSALMRKLKADKVDITMQSIRDFMWRAALSKTTNMLKIPREAQLFCCTRAKSAYQFLLGSTAGKRILDFSAGWGDRLLAAIAADADYTGYDPNEMLVDGHQGIIQMFGSADRHRVRVAPFETAEVEANHYDLVFTSPPFFKVETYIRAATQSIERYPEFELWLDGFLKLSLTKCYQALVPGGRLALHLADDQEHDIMTPTITHLLSLGFVFDGCFGMFRSQSGVPIWVFTKSV